MPQRRWFVIDGVAQIALAPAASDRGVLMHLRVVDFAQDTDRARRSTRFVR